MTLETLFGLALMVAPAVLAILLGRCSPDGIEALFMGYREERANGIQEEDPPPRWNPAALGRNTGEPTVDPSRPAARLRHRRCSMYSNCP
jgi:hypothetical protein